MLVHLHLQEEEVEIILLNKPHSSTFLVPPYYSLKHPDIFYNKGVSQLSIVFDQGEIKSEDQTLIYQRYVSLYPTSLSLLTFVCGSDRERPIISILQLFI